MKKPKLLLLDADVVLVSYRFGVWEGIKAKYDVHVTSIVAYEEIKYFTDSTGTTHRGDLDQQAERGEIKIVEATASEMSQVVENFVDAFRKGLDDGETEAIAVLRRGELEDCRFCTGDTNGIQAIGMLGLGPQTISLEEILDLGGLRASLAARLPPQFNQRHRETHLQKGSERRITNEYFKRPPLTS